MVVPSARRVARRFLAARIVQIPANSSDFKMLLKWRVFQNPKKLERMGLRFSMYGHHGPNAHVTIPPAKTESQARREGEAWGKKYEQEAPWARDTEQSGLIEWTRVGKPSLWSAVVNYYHSGA
jgi:hypothetical protein